MVSEKFVAIERDMSMMFKHLIWVAVALPSAAIAAEGPDAAVTTLISGLEELRKPSKRTTTIVQNLHQRLDIDGLAERSLAETWTTLNAKQKKDFRALLRELMEKVAYPNAAKAFSPSFDRDIAASVKKGQNHWVSVEISHPDQGLIELDFVLTEKAGSWRVMDVHLDGVSLALNIRNQMQAVIKKDSYAVLLERIREKIDTEKS